jgi:uncharacterized protein (DUF1697 family)
VADHAAFLRGINLGKAHRVSSAELKSVFEDLGLTDVATFRASGNVAFSGEATGAQIEERLEQALGYPVAVFVRSAKELWAIAGSEPFPPADVEASNGKLQIAMLPAKPTAVARKKVLAMASAEDPLVFGPRELYWLPSGGLMESDLDLGEIDKLVGPTTRRTMGTVEQMAAKLFARPG